MGNKELSPKVTSEIRQILDKANWPPLPSEKKYDVVKDAEQYLKEAQHKLWQRYTDIMSWG